MLRLNGCPVSSTTSSARTTRRRLLAGIVGRGRCVPLGETGVQRRSTALLLLALELGPQRRVGPGKHEVAEQAART